MTWTLDGFTSHHKTNSTKNEIKIILKGMKKLCHNVLSVKKPYFNRNF